MLLEKEPFIPKQDIAFIIHVRVCYTAVTLRLSPTRLSTQNPTNVDHLVNLVENEIQMILSNVEHSHPPKTQEKCKGNNST